MSAGQVTGALQGAPQSFARRNVSVAAAAIPFNMGGRQSVDFVPSAVINAPKTWVLSNTNNAFEFRFTFTTTGLFAQTMPANFVMSDPLWDDVTNVWTPVDVGTFEALATFNGTNWFLKIVGLYI